MFMPSRVLDAFWTVDYLERLNEDVRTSPLADVKVSGRSCRGVRVVRFEDQFDFWLEPFAPHLPCKLVSRRSDGSSQSVMTHVFTWSTSNLELLLNLGDGVPDQAAAVWAWRSPVAATSSPSVNFTP